MRVCSVPGCPEIFPKGEGSKCARHRAEADRARGSSYERGYSTRGHRTFRDTVLTRNPICTLCGIALATVADHHPHSRRELIELNLNPNNPKFGRGLCHNCHSKETATNQPGGWNQ